MMFVSGQNNVDASWRKTGTLKAAEHPGNEATALALALNRSVPRKSCKLQLQPLIFILIRAPD